MGGCLLYRWRVAGRPARTGLWLPACAGRSPALPRCLLVSRTRTRRRRRGYLRSIRRGERPLAEVLDAIAGAEARLTGLRDSPAIPDQPDRRWVDDWLYRSYQEFWARRH